MELKEVIFEYGDTTFKINSIIERKIKISKVFRQHNAWLPEKEKAVTGNAQLLNDFLLQ